MSFIQAQGKFIREDVDSEDYAAMTNEEKDEHSYYDKIIINLDHIESAYARQNKEELNVTLVSGERWTVLREDSVEKKLAELLA